MKKINYEDQVDTKEEKMYEPPNPGSVGAMLSQLEEEIRDTAEAVYTLQNLLEDILLNPNKEETIKGVDQDAESYCFAPMAGRIEFMTTQLTSVRLHLQYIAERVDL